MGAVAVWRTLVVHCDRDMLPHESLHSRADGTMHGVTTLCEYAGSLLVAAKGAGMLLRVPLNRQAVL